MTEDVYSRLEQLTGEEKYYQGNKITILSFKEINQTIVIKTKERTYVFTQIEIEDFFKDLKEVSGNNKSVANINKDTSTNVTINGYQPTKENITLKSSLLEVLADVKKDPNEKNMQKARSVCDIANTLVSIQKAEIQMINAIKR